MEKLKHVKKGHKTESTLQKRIQIVDLPFMDDYALVMVG